jgi:hypothetical protein
MLRACSAVSMLQVSCAQVTKCPASSCWHHHPGCLTPQLVCVDRCLPACIGARCPVGTARCSGGSYLLGSMVTTGDHCGERRRHRAMPCLAARQVCQTEHTGAITKTWQGAPLQKPGSSVSNMLSYHSLIRCWTTVIGIAVLQQVCCMVSGNQQHARCHTERACNSCVSAWCPYAGWP